MAVDTISNVNPDTVQPDITTALPDEPAKVTEPAKVEPAVQPATEQVPATETAPANEADPWPTHTDPNMSSALTVMQEAGMTVKEADEIFKEAADTQDFSKIKVDKLKEKLGDAKANLVLSAIKLFSDTTKAQEADIKSRVYAAVGGEENFNLVKSWANTKEATDPEFKVKLDAIRSMLNQGPVIAEIAAKELKGLYNMDSNNTTLNANVVTGDKSASASAESATLTRQQYLDKLKVAYKDRNESEVKRLNALRIASMKAGY